MSSHPATRGRPRRGRGRMSVNSRHLDHLRFFGGPLRGLQDPPRVLLTPWHSIVLQFDIVGTAVASSYCLTPSTVKTRLTFQTSISGNMQFRFQRCSVWQQTPNGELNNQVSARFFDLSASSTTCSLTDTLAQISDHGTPARLANIHYQWPQSMQMLIGNDTSTTPFVRVALGPSQQVLLHLHMLFRGQGAANELCHCNVEGLHVCPMHTSDVDDF